ncbi:MAG: glycine cleavage system aminomethyltransferase GcvT [Opitutales bacterium]|jgi:aminomethyltransferase|nr:glycine cleavage system aminomethyltransferase GcvT [Opitutales bacterium]MDP4643557.1 glycine cleavage system aminomethyltransferase GcvT [Opitutales bacterium]MDP4693400.1 glycine cleavage system aminomethyltransferase GcvT [Opitutales bacterium]MDP4778361.1 glycine cleavage system aminomethyltransferase GcvT [Opitutales bacterium]MDP4884052.1 glycine cleavage system aminomethyltransferase GcvT [Opitutales bacterium]
MLEIPLHNFHAEQGARFVAFGGWNMPVQYSSILEEHKAVRTSAGLFDVSHMGEFHVHGADAALFLDRLVVNAVRKAPVGKAVYSPMCMGDGGVVDDLIIYRTGEETFLVCVNASNIEKDFGWFLKQAERWALDVEIEDHSDEYALLALQGPKAEAILMAIGLDGVSDIKRFWHTQISFSGEKIRVCRTGYTGEDGFEIYSSPKAVEQLAKQILIEGEAFGLKLCGLGARDSLRLEAGLPLYGHELSDNITPLEASLDWTVKLNKEDFIGKNALTEQKENGIPRRVLHFKLEGRRIAREGTPVINEAGEAIGKVLSGTLSPMINCPIGSAIINSDSLNEPLFVDLRGNKLALQIAKPPLHK